MSWWARLRAWLRSRFRKPKSDDKAAQ